LSEFKLKRRTPIKKSQKQKSIVSKMGSAPVLVKVKICAKWRLLPVSP